MREKKQTSVTEEQIDELISKSKIKAVKLGSKTCVLFCRLPNKFEVITSSSCVNLKDFSLEVGEQLCRARLKDKLWELEGYVSHNILTKK